ncbi:MAG: hypothetical protein FWF76_07690 [Oscillospiraceae bacterium]|nr:hypothetical protein [Oscillospiraceae bacterium]
MKTTFLNFARLFWLNIKTIIFSLILAIIIWFAISFQLFPDVTRPISVPISAELSAYMQDVNLQLAEDFSEIIDVLVEGRRYEIMGITADDFRVELDFTGINEPGTFEVPVTILLRPDAGRSDNFAITNQGDTRTVTIIQTAEKTLQIIPNIESVSAAEGMEIESGGAYVSPNSVTIQGERSLIDRISGAKVNAHSDSEISELTNLPGELVFLGVDGEVLAPYEIEGIQVEDRAFVVSVPVFMHKTLPLEVNFTNVPDNFDLEGLLSRMVFEPSELTIASPDRTIDAHDSWSLGTFSLSSINLDDLENGRVIQVSLPPGYRNISGYGSVAFGFEGVDDYKIVTLNIPASSFYVTNAPAGYNVNPRLGTVQINVIGPSDVVEALTVTDIVGTINFAGIGEIMTGTRFVGITFTIAGEDVEAWVIGTYEVEVAVTRRS